MATTSTTDAKSPTVMKFNVQSTEDLATPATRFGSNETPVGGDSTGQGRGRLMMPSPVASSTPGSQSRSRSVKISLEAKNEVKEETAAITIELDDPEEMVDHVLAVLAARFPMDAFYSAMGQQQARIREVCQERSTSMLGTMTYEEKARIFQEIATNHPELLISLSPASRAVMEKHQAEEGMDAEKLMRDVCESLDGSAQVAVVNPTEDPATDETAVFQQEGKWESLGDEEMLADKDTERSKTLSSSSISQKEHTEAKTGGTHSIASSMSVAYRVKCVSGTHPLIEKGLATYPVVYVNYVLSIPPFALHDLLQINTPEMQTSFTANVTCNPVLISGLLSYINSTEDFRHWCESLVSFGGYTPTPAIPKYVAVTQPPQNLAKGTGVSETKTSTHLEQTTTVAGHTLAATTLTQATTVTGALQTTTVTGPAQATMISASEAGQAGMRHEANQEGYQMQRETSNRASQETMTSSSFVDTSMAKQETQTFEASSQTTAQRISGFLVKQLQPVIGTTGRPEDAARIHRVPSSHSSSGVVKTRPIFHPAAVGETVIPVNDSASGTLQQTLAQHYTYSAAQTASAQVPMTLQPTATAQADFQSSATGLREQTDASQNVLRSTMAGSTTTTTQHESTQFDHSAAHAAYSSSTQHAETTLGQATPPLDAAASKDLRQTTSYQEVIAPSTVVTTTTTYRSTQVTGGLTRDFEAQTAPAGGYSTAETITTTGYAAPVITRSDEAMSSHSFRAAETSKALTSEKTSNGLPVGDQPSVTGIQPEAATSYATFTATTTKVDTIAQNQASSQPQTAEEPQRAPSVTSSTKAEEAETIEAEGQTRQAMETTEESQRGYSAQPPRQETTVASTETTTCQTTQVTGRSPSVSSYQKTQAETATVQAATVTTTADVAAPTYIPPVSYHTIQVAERSPSVASSQKSGAAKVTTTETITCQTTQVTGRSPSVSSYQKTQAETATVQAATVTTTADVAAPTYIPPVSYQTIQVAERSPSVASSQKSGAAKMTTTETITCQTTQVTGRSPSVSSYQKTQAGTAMAQGGIVTTSGNVTVTTSIPPISYHTMQVTERPASVTSSQKSEAAKMVAGINTGFERTMRADLSPSSSGRQSGELQRADLSRSGGEASLNRQTELSGRTSSDAMRTAMTEVSTEQFDMTQSGGVSPSFSSTQRTFIETRQHIPPATTYTTTQVLERPPRDRSVSESSQNRREKLEQGIPLTNVPRGVASLSSYRSTEVIRKISETVTVPPTAKRVSVSGTSERGAKAAAVDGQASLSHHSVSEKSEHRKSQHDVVSQHLSVHSVSQRTGSATSLVQSESSRWSQKLKTELEVALQAEERLIRSRILSTMSGVFSRHGVPVCSMLSESMEHNSEVSVMIERFSSAFKLAALAAAQDVFAASSQQLAELGFDTVVPGRSDLETYAFFDEAVIKVLSQEVQNSEVAIATYKLIKEAAVRAAVIRLAAALTEPRTDFQRPQAFSVELQNVMNTPVNRSERRMDPSIEAAIAAARADALRSAYSDAVDVDFEQIGCESILSFVESTFAEMTSINAELLKKHAYQITHHAEYEGSASTKSKHSDLMQLPVMPNQARKTSCGDSESSCSVSPHAIKPSCIRSIRVISSISPSNSPEGGQSPMSMQMPKGIYMTDVYHTHEARQGHFTETTTTQTQNLLQTEKAVAEASVKNSSLEAASGRSSWGMAGLPGVRMDVLHSPDARSALDYDSGTTLPTKFMMPRPAADASSLSDVVNVGAALHEMSKKLQAMGDSVTLLEASMTPAHARTPSHYIVAKTETATISRVERENSHNLLGNLAKLYTERK